MNWAFQNPWLLMCGLASLVPLILYFLRRRTPQQVEWAAMQFLQDASRTPASKRKLKQWLLLAVRMALPILIAVVVSTPGCDRTGKAGRIGHESFHWMLVFDVSASMGLCENGESGLSDAIARARDIVEQAGTGDRFSIVSSGVNEPRTVAAATADQATALNCIESLQPTNGVFAPEAVFQHITDLAEKQRIAASEATRVVIFSDFSEADWGQLEDTQRPLAAIRRASVSLVPCRQSLPSIAIRQIDVIPRAVTTGQAIECQVVLAATGLIEETETTVELIVNGQRVGQQTVSIQPGESASASFSISGSGQPGTLEIEAVIPNSGWLFDDRRFQTVEVRSEINVLCIEGRANAAKNYVAATEAIQTSGLPAISSVVVDLSRVTDVNPESIDVIALFGCDRLSETQLAWIEDRLNDGVGAIFSLGPETDISSWQGLLQRVDSQLELTEVVNQGDYRFHPEDYQHVILKDFRDLPRSGLIDVPIYQYRKLEAETGNSHAILAFDDGAAAWVVSEARHGKVLISTTPLHPTTGEGRAWNQLPAWWSYVPLVNNATVWLFGTSGHIRPLNVGDSYQWKPGRNDGASVFFVETPSNERQNQGVQQSEGERFLESTAVQPGFVRFFQQTNSESPVQVVAFNISSLEQSHQQSDMTKLRSVFPSPENTTTKSHVESSERSRIVYLVCLGLICLLLIVEPLLANRRRLVAARWSP